MSIYGKELHPGLYGNEDELVRVIKVTQQNPSSIQVVYTWLKGNASQYGRHITVVISPHASWRLHELPFVIEEWL